MRTMLSAAAIAGSAALIFSSSAAQAAVLITLTNPPSQRATPYELAFIATANTTVIEFSGYQQHTYEYVSGINVTLGGDGANLLGTSWTFEAAAKGSDARTINDGTPVPALWFGGYVPGYYDTFSQTLDTTPGDTYVVDFEFSSLSRSRTANPRLFAAFDALPSAAFTVETPTGLLGPLPVPTPEPSTWAMALIGFATLGFVGFWRRRRASSIGRASC